MVRAKIVCLNENFDSVMSKKLVRGIWVLVLPILLFVVQPLRAQTAPSSKAPRNVILMIADGGGPASFTMARDYLRDRHGSAALALDSIQVGSVRTYSTDSRVTDSAAGATAFSTGVKTYNGAIAVDPDKQPLTTLLEAAEQRGMATGLIATSRVTHATPASFAAHVPDRWQENEIASQMMQQNIDLIFGGGRRHFLPSSQKGQREDERNLLEEAREDGYQVVTTRRALDRSLQLPVLGLFSMSHMDYEVDRDTSEEPSLEAMTRRGINLLKERPEGFFLMVEGSRIDHAGHGNDPTAMLHDVLAYNQAVAEVLQFARQNERTLVVSVADHETGGLSLGRNLDGSGVYAWHPDVLGRVRSSLPVMVSEVEEGASPAAVLQEYAGIDTLSNAERTLLEKRRAENQSLKFAFSEIISRRALIGWTTKGHTGVDVNLYAYGPGSARFRGHHDNTYLGQVLADLLGFDLSYARQ